MTIKINDTNGDNKALTIEISGDDVLLAVIVNNYEYAPVRVNKKELIKVLSIPEIKPCPFCGVALVFHKDYNTFVHDFDKCVLYLKSLPLDSISIDQWNTRIG